MSVRDEAKVWDDFPHLEDVDFNAVVTEYQQVRADIAALELRKDELSLEIQAALAVVGEKRVKWGDHYCVETANGRSASKVDAKLLLAKGVPVTTINECMVPGKPYTYAQLVDLQKTKAVPGQPQGDEYDAPTE